MDGYPNIDAAYAALLVLAKRRDDALNACEAEQAAGRTGLDQYRQAVTLHAEVNALAGKLAAAIERERASL